MTGSARRDVSVAGGRAELPRPLADEIVRSRLVESLARRWDVELTIVEAAGGYGKSVAIGQAIRDNDDDPSGIDVYARFRGSQDSVNVVAAALVDALTARRLVSTDRSTPPRSEWKSPGAAASAVASAVADLSPIDVCVCLDDVHLADDIDGAETFVGVLLDDLPVNGHVLLAGRSVDFVKRARRRAADALLEIDEGALTFDRDEIEAMAGRHGVEAETLALAAGWPAVTRLAVKPGFDASREFLLEELVAELPDATRRALFVAVTAGLASADLLDACDVDVDVAELVRSVPLLVEYDEGFGVHDLWQEVVDHLVDDSDATVLAGQIIDTLSATGRLPEAIGIAMRHNLVDDALTHIMSLFEDGDDRVTDEMVNRWIAGLGDGLADRPEADFLAGFRLRLAGEVADGAALLSRAAAGFETRGDVEAETTTVKELAMSSWLLGDPSIWSEASERSRRLIEAGSERMRHSMRSGRIAVLDLRADFDGIMEMYLQFDEFDEIGLRHAATVAVLVGDVPQAIEWAERLVDEFPKPLVRGQLDATYWQVGQPRIERLMRQRQSVDLGNARNQFLSLVFSSMMGACVGRVPDVRPVDSLSWSRSRERTFVALVHAAHDVLTASEDAAAAAFVERLDAIGHDDPLLRGELRRFLPYAYVLSPVDRAWMDDEDLSPLHTDVRALARALVSTREQPRVAVGALPSHEAIVAWFPLPWSVELAVRLAHAHDDRGVALAAALSGWIGAPVHRELRRFRDAVPALGRAADSILAVVPGPPAVMTRLTVCDVTSLHRDEVEHTVSRGRVRQALQLLTLRPWWTRSGLAHAMWPDLDEARAGANLRSTLRHLRLALEPDREAGEADFHLRHGDNRLTLHRSDWLEVDVWQIDEHLADAGVAESSGRIEEAIEFRLAAFGLWSEDAFAESRDIAEVEGVIAEYEHRVVGAAAWAAERLLSIGDHAGALATARLLLAHDPLSERAHDVRVGVHLATGDLSAAAISLRELIAASEAMGVAPSSGSEMLIRRYERRSGRHLQRSQDPTAG